MGAGADGGGGGDASGSGERGAPVPPLLSAAPYAVGFRARIARALRAECAAAGLGPPPGQPEGGAQPELCVLVYSALADNNEERRMPEFQAFAAMCSLAGLPCRVLSSSELRGVQDAARPGGYGLVVAATGEPVALLYNKLDNDRCLLMPSHAHVRRALLAGSACLTPHPASFARCCDKRRLEQIEHACVLPCLALGSRKPEQWWSERAQWVFKPPTGFASRDVVMGTALTQVRGAPWCCAVGCEVLWCRLRNTGCSARLRR
jgi:hypothetical protein